MWNDAEEIQLKKKAAAFISRSAPCAQLINYLLEMTHHDTVPQVFCVLFVDAYCNRVLRHFVALLVVYEKNTGTRISCSRMLSARGCLFTFKQG